MLALLDNIEDICTDKAIKQVTLYFYNLGQTVYNYFISFTTDYVEGVYNNVIKAGGTSVAPAKTKPWAGRGICWGYNGFLV